MASSELGQGQGETRAWRLWAIALVAAAVVSFGGAAAAEFVGWDDHFNLYQNARLNPPTIAGVGHYWLNAAHGLYIPLTYTVWGMLAALSNGPPDSEGLSMNPWVFHGFNVLLHAGSALVAFAILSRFAGTAAAAAGAMLFVVHPAQVESVAWAAGMKDVLSGLLVLVALWQYVEFSRAWQRGREIAAPEREGTRKLLADQPALGARWHYALATVAFILAILAKPSAMVAPALAFAMDWWLLRRPAGRIWRALAPWMVLSGFCAIVARLAQDTTGVDPAPLWARPLIAGDSLAFYLWKLIWPASLTVDYGRTPATVMQSGWMYLTWMGPAALGAFLWMNRRRWPELWVAAMVFVVAVSPVLGLFTFQFQYISTVADHYLYVAMLGPALAASWLMDRALRRWNQAAVLSVCGMLLVVLAVRSMLQTVVWQDSWSLFRHALRMNPRSFVARNGLGHLHNLRGEHAAAEEVLRQAVDLKPDYWLARQNLAFALEMQGRLEEAVEQHRAALTVLEQRGAYVEEQIAPAAAALGRDLALLGRYEEAIVYLQIAAERRPDDPALRAAVDEVQRRRAAAGSTQPSAPP